MAVKVCPIAHLRHGPDHLLLLLGALQAHVSGVEPQLCEQGARAGGVVGKRSVDGERSLVRTLNNAVHRTQSILISH